MVPPAEAPSPRARGRRYEDVAVSLLRFAGLRVVERNVEAAGAEIDVVAEDRDGTWVFVEVRARAEGRRGRPEETVGPAKRRRIVRGATGYLVAHDLWERVPVRFDVIAVEGPCPGEGCALTFTADPDDPTVFASGSADGEGLVVRWYRGAFEA
ncbi:MAG: YraN family protein [Deltaproteobacteria bacterium]|nr:MAG: YraN family protein [Deltaproteobacteria bacterium]